MASVNKVILIGNLGADPETRYLPSGDAVTNIRIATTEKWRDKGGEQQEHTEWHRIAFFGKLAEIAGEYLKKGSPVYVEGRIRTRKWKSDRSHVVLGAKELGKHVVFLRPLGLRLRRRQKSIRSSNSMRPSCGVPKGLTVPSCKEREGSGMIRSRSMPIVRPNPRQVSQAPSGLLNEKRFGNGGLYRMLQWAHSS